ncbi:hypothetical protein BOW53_10615 [Solemya pervernicosa gill symbiont]|uniref:Guanylate cyclase domain-containing protein n=2 Tax=Gammaproteobacteria incertae sedis TaxID=118884 RepID=A0A1T2L3L7_9GAMM|nr:adenylate/guanylate cyclase domain-containing protein [Candidatus Reidiella endopervernicosa]OOZ39659.1 hypothetical protein BOW53_10615 [Solemya pervernicosa gill symbiont]QKQ27746.1 adenylate/guanylate cyclase domain-containing protein [Candidatus Reidiella endopervernicosa]
MLRRFFNTKYFPVSVGLFITLLACWMQITRVEPFHSLQKRMELIGYDLILRKTVHNQVAPDQRVIIVDIDEKSLKRIGRWPWPRNMLATMTQKLFEQGTVIVGYDQVFADAEENIARQLYTALESLDLGDAKSRSLLTDVEKIFNHDEQLAATIGQGDSVLGFMFNYSDVESARPAPPPAPFKISVAPSMTSIIEMPNYITNIESLEQNAIGHGFLTTFPDDDGIIRRTPLLLRYGEQIYPSLALEVVRSFLLLDDYSIHVEEIGDRYAVESILLGDKRIPTSDTGQVVVPFRGPSGSYRYVSASDVIEGLTPPGLFANSIVLVGTTAQGLNDLVPTPVESVFPGVEIHANIISAILDNSFLNVPAWAEGANLVILLITGLVLALLLPFLSPVMLLLSSVLVALIDFNLVSWLWSSHGYILNFASPIILTLMLAIPNMLYGLLNESQRRKELKSIFGQYIPPQLVEEMSKNNATDFGFEGESRVMTVLFADIRSFTTISESLSPSELKHLLNLFFTDMTRIIFENKGTIDKYVGDMIMAFWGAPIDDPNHRHHAILAALEMLKETERLKQSFKEQGLPEINIGIGLNTGTMSVGDMGSTFRRSYTVLGDAVNLGSRLEGQTKSYGVGLIVGETTHAEQTDILFRRLDLVQVKGKTEPVHIFEPICLRDEADEALFKEIEINEQAITLFQSGELKESLALYHSLAGSHPEIMVYRIYIGRINEILESNTPLDDWSGVHVLTTK